MVPSKWKFRANFWFSFLFLLVFFFISDFTLSLTLIDDALPVVSWACMAFAAPAPWVMLTKKVSASPAFSGKPTDSPVCCQILLLSFHPTYRTTWWSEKYCFWPQRLIPAYILDWIDKNDRFLVFYCIQCVVYSRVGSSSAISSLGVVNSLLCNRRYLIMSNFYFACSSVSFFRIFFFFGGHIFHYVLHF